MGILGWILAYLGNLNFASGKLAEAEAFYKKAVKRKAGNGLPYLNYAILLLGQGGRTADAIDLLEKSLTVKKRSALTEKNIYITRVTAFWLHGDLDRATDAITEVEKRYEYLSASALTTFGFIYILKGDLQKAAELTEKALADNADYSSAWDNLGQIKFRQEDFTEAKQAFEKAVLLNPRMSDSLYYIALIEIKDGNIETAKKYLSQALECNITTFNTVSREEIENTQKNLEI